VFLAPFRVVVGRNTQSIPSSAALKRIKKRSKIRVFHLCQQALNFMEIFILFAKVLPIMADIKYVGIM